MLRLALSQMGVNRSQGLVLAFFAAVWVALAAILAWAPAIYLDALRTAGLTSPGAGLGLFAGVSVLVGVLVVRVVKRWRWAFWLVVAAFLAGLLRLPASFLELIGLLPRMGPSWYEAFQGGVGAVQFVIGVLLVRGYRRGGVWGAF